MGNVVCSVLTAQLLVGAVEAVVLAVTQLLSRQADGGVVGTNVVREFTNQRLTVVLIRVVLAVAVPVAHPRFTDAARYRITR